MRPFVVNGTKIMGEKAKQASEEAGHHLYKLATKF